MATSVATFQAIMLNLNAYRKISSYCHEHFGHSQEKLIRLWLRERRKSPDSVKNLSSRSLTIEEDALRFEFDNHILPKKLQTDDIKAQIEKLFYFINKENKLIDDNFEDEVKFMFKKFVNLVKTTIK